MVKDVDPTEARFEEVAEVVGPALQAVAAAQGTTVKEAIKLVAKQAAISVLTVSQLRTGARQPSSKNHGCARPVADAVRQLTNGEHILVFPARTKAETRAAYARPTRAGARATAARAARSGTTHVFPGAKGARCEITAAGVTVTLL